MKRSMAVNIFLRQFKMPNVKVLKLIEDCNSTEVEHERLLGLLKIMPEKDEVLLLETLSELKILDLINIYEIILN